MHAQHACLECASDGASPGPTCMHPARWFHRTLFMMLTFKPPPHPTPFVSDPRLAATKLPLEHRTH